MIRLVSASPLAYYLRWQSEWPMKVAHLLTEGESGRTVLRVSVRVGWLVGG